jgi:hypothetical protein
MSHVNIIIKLLCWVPFTNGEDMILTLVRPLCVRGSNPGGDEIFRPSRPALGPTQPPVQWVPGLSRGVKCGRGVLLTTHLLLAPRSWKSRAIPLPPPPPRRATTGPVTGLIYDWFTSFVQCALLGWLLSTETCRNNSPVYLTFKNRASSI